MHDHGIGGQEAIIRRQSRLLAAIGSAEDLLDLQHRRGLNDRFHAFGIVDARQLDQDLVFAESMLLNHRLADAKGVNATTDGFDGLRDRMFL